MEELFNKPILDQMYEFRKEDIERAVYKENEEIKNIESGICELINEFINLLKEIIPNQKNFETAKKMFDDFTKSYNSEIDFWSLIYFKIGMIEREKIRNEFFRETNKIKDNDTFINYFKNNLSEWIEEQKRKYIFETKEYKELQKRYNDISKQYPNVTKVYEDLSPIQLNKEEMKALVDLREIDIEMRYMELNLCFKLGMKEVIDF